MVLSSTAFAVTKQGIAYIALGDSIAFGTGASEYVGYADLLNEHFKKQFGVGTYLNLSYDGMTSEDLKFALENETDLYGVQFAVSQADIITISIGGNDLLGPFLESFGEVIFEYYLNADFTLNYMGLLNDLSEWENDPTTHYQFNEMLMGLSTELPILVNNFALNWWEIIDRIRDLNPNADIYVNTVFNPLRFSPSLYQFADPAIHGLNLPIITLAGNYDYKVVDVYSEFETYGNPKKLIVGDLSSLAIMTDPGYDGPIPLHPTDMGYKFIFNLHKDLLE